MSFTRSDRDIPPPFGPAVVKRGLHIERVVMQRSATTGAWAVKDISAARYTYRLRVWTSDDDAAALSDVLIVKGTDQASGELASYYSCGATVRDTLAFEIVEVDNDNADATTTSTFRERILARWYQPIIDAP